VAASLAELKVEASLEEEAAVEVSLEEAAVPWSTMVAVVS